MGFNVLKMFPKRNVFNLSHDRKFDMDMGELIPILCEEVLPGDSFKVQTDMLVRLSPMINPTYHEVNVKTAYFFVPNRIIWTDWEKFITGGTDGKDTTVHPYILQNNVATYSLQDYLGVPINVAVNFNVSALPARAYAQIFNDWFRDQTLQSLLTVSKGNGQDLTTVNTIQYVNWEKDYFTSALPWTQRGDPVTISLGGTADVTIPGGVNPNQLSIVSDNGGTESHTIIDSADGYRVKKFTADGGDGALELKGEKDSGELTGTADLSTATPITINDLRLATQIQRFMEKMARTGARYVEYIMGMFGIRSDDARLQRAEYLGGGKSQVIVSEVLQTSSTDATTPQGNMAGHGFAAHRSHEFKKSFTEHGLVMGLMWVLPRTAYQNGVSRTLSRTTKYDYYVPLLAHLGEQPILNKELWLDAADGLNEVVFGYQGRFDEYRRRESSVHGNFRSPTGLGTFHMGRMFTSRPELNEAFIKANTVTKRIFADTNDKALWVYLKNNVKAIRPIPKLGEPGFMDH